MPHRFTNLERHEVVGSTNAIAAQAGRAGVPEGLVVVAEEQVAGRGRRDRRWIAPRGSALLCSVLFRPELGVEEFHLVVSAVALAALAALRRCGLSGGGLKWPNDLVVGGRKLGGILAEIVNDQIVNDQIVSNQGGDPKRPALVVGLGCNLAWPTGWPGESAPPEVVAIVASATTLAEQGLSDIRAEELLVPFLEELEIRYRSLADPASVATLLAEYRGYCTTLGEPVRVELANGVVHGVAVDIANDGRLILDDGTARHLFGAADVVHLREAATVIGGPEDDIGSRYP